MSTPGISLVETASVCATLDVSGYDIATAVMALAVMRLAGLLAVTLEPAA